MHDVLFIKSPDPEDVHQHNFHTEDFLSVPQQHFLLLPLLAHLQMAKQTNLVKLKLQPVTGTQRIHTLLFSLLQEKPVKSGIFSLLLFISGVFELGFK